VITFMGVAIETGPGALVPRAETELLGKVALGKLDQLGGELLIDVCCGTGNLACAIAIARPRLRAWALDLTDGAIALARANVSRLGLAERVTVLQGDLFTPLAELGVVADVITCNPPYISTGKLAQRHDLAHEPREAFDGGPYGVSIHQRVAREAHAMLRRGGWLVCELGLGQDKQLQRVFERAGGYDRIELANDDTGAARVVAARREEMP
jgi:release factor glutamine methyltransferase